MKTIIPLDTVKPTRQPHMSVERSRDGEGVFMRVPRSGFLILTREQAASLAASLQYLTRSEESAGHNEQE